MNFSEHLTVSASRRLLPLLLLLLLASATACKKDPNAEKQAFYTQGMAYLKEKKVQEARIEFRNALLIDKKYADAWAGLGETELLVNNIRQAFDAFAAVTDLDPNNLEARVKLGNLFLQYYKPAEVAIKEAERYARETLAKDANHVEGRILLASVRTTQKRWDEAKAELDKALALNNNRPETWMSVARYFEQRARAAGSPAETKTLLDEAERTFRKASELDTKSTLARLALSDFYYANNRRADAERELRQAFAQDQKDKLLLAALQRFYENERNYGEAEKYGQLLSEQEPDQNTGRLQIIDMHARAGKIDQAIQEYDGLIKDNPKFMRAYSRQAELLLSKGDIERAGKRIEEALNTSRGDTDAMLVRGRIHLLNGKFQEAERDLAQVLKNEPSMPQALYFMADTHLQNGEPDRARNAINELLRFYPSSPSGMLMLIRVYISQNKIDEALKAADEILNGIAYLKSNAAALQASRLTPEMLPELESKAYTSRAVARLQRRDVDGAQSDLERAAQLDQQNAEPLTNLATLNLLKNDNARAQELSERALSLMAARGNLNPQTISTAINVYLQKKDFTAAHAKLDELLAKHPENGFLQDQKADVYIKQGDGANYEKTLRALLEKKPDYINAYFKLSQYYLSINQAERAIAELQTVVTRRTGNARQMGQALLMSGLLEEGRGRFDAALKFYEQSLGYDRTTVSAAIAYNNMAWLMVERVKGGNQDKAADYVQSAIKISPEASFYDTLGWIYYKKGLHGVAIEQFKKAIEKNPRSPTYQLHLARALRDNREYDKAKGAYQEALKLGGDKFTEAKQAREELGTLK
ncbi:MAG: tetratricopeptide repeat protein [Blastocatellia bacterium]